MTFRQTVLILLASVAFAHAAGTISSSSFDIELPVPDGWTPRTTDTSLSISSNHERGGTTVVIGIQFSRSLAPYATEKEWREQAISSFITHLGSMAGRLLTPSSKGVFRGDTTEDARYIALDLSTNVLFAGSSRFLARGGKGFELFVMGDTLPIYTDFPHYDSILASARHLASGSIPRPGTPDQIYMQRHSPLRLQVRGGTLIRSPLVVDLHGRIVPSRASCQADGSWIVEFTREPSAPFLVRTDPTGPSRLFVR